MLVKVGDGTLWPRSLLEKTLGSLGLVLAFARRCLVGPLQCSQFVAQPFFTLLEPLLHQLLELPQLLAQLGLDVGLEDAHLTCRRGERQDKCCLGMSYTEQHCFNLGTVSHLFRGRQLGSVVKLHFQPNIGQITQCVHQLFLWETWMIMIP